MAWIGIMRDLKQVLADERADKDKDGRYLVASVDDGSGHLPRPVTFMGMAGDDAEVVVPDGVCFRKDGKWFEIVPRMTKVGFSGFKVL